MLKILFIAVIFAAVGFAAGVGTTVFYYPFWFPPAEVNEVIHDTDNKFNLTHGEFVTPDPDDKIHWGKGKLDVYEASDKYEVYFHPDFEVGPGPDYHVYLVKAKNIANNADFESAEKVEISKLKSFKGSQVYAAEKDLNIREYKSVIVWCKMFGQLITVAQLSH